MRLHSVLRLIVFIDILYFRLVEATLQLDFMEEPDHHLWNISKEVNQYCFNSVANLVIFSDDSSSSRSPFLASLFADRTPSYVFGKDGNKTLQEHQRFRHVYRLEPIHVSRKTYPASSVTIFLKKDTDFLGLMKHLKNSIWWNSRANFLLIDLESTGCELGEPLLKLIWSFKVLSAIYICKNQENQVVFQTFNPYSHLAPKFWLQQNRILHLDNGWTTLGHTFENAYDFSSSFNSTLCRILYYDKLENMYGYNLKLLNPVVAQFYKMAIGNDRYTTNFKIILNFMKSINATYTVKYINPRALFYANGTPDCSIEEVISGVMDLYLTAIFLRDIWWLQTYPYYNSEVKILTSVNSRYTINFFMIFTPGMWIFLTLLCILTILCLKYVLKSNPSLEFVRIFVNTATLRMPEHYFEKVCFFLLIYMWLIINIYIQSNFRADKIAINNERKVDSLEDLIESNYTVYGMPSYNKFIFNDKIRQQYIAIANPEKLIELAARGKHVASLIGQNNLKRLLHADMSVYISKSHLLERGTSWILSEDSPLRSKVSYIVSRLNQAGIIKFFTALDDLRFKRNVFNEGDTQRYGIIELIIALRIWFVGCIFALAIFVFEIMVRIISNRVRMFD